MINPNQTLRGPEFEVFTKKLGALDALVPGAATGAIGPNSFADEQRAKMLEFELINNDPKYYKSPNPSGELVKSCIDGRSPYEQVELTANSAGGTIGLYVAFLAMGNSITVSDFVTRMKAANLPIGGHGDNQNHGTGCGANDRLLNILHKMEDSQAEINLLRSGLGYQESMTNGDCLKSLQDIFTPSDDESESDLAEARISAIQEAADSESVPKLDGKHGEVLAIWNKATDKKTLDRQALSALTKQSGLTKSDGTEMEAFNVDAWSFRETARKMLEAQFGAEFDVASGETIKEPTYLPTAAEAAQVTDFLIDYNIATTLVLGGGGLNVLLRGDDE